MWEPGNGRRTWTEACRKARRPQPYTGHARVVAPKGDHPGFGANADDERAGDGGTGQLRPLHSRRDFWFANRTGGSCGGPHGLRVFDRMLLELTAFRAAFKLDPRTPEEDDAVLCDFINSTFTMGSFPGEATKVYAAFVDLLPDYGRVGRLALPRLMLALAG